MSCESANQANFSPKNKQRPQHSMRKLGWSTCAKYWWFCLTGLKPQSTLSCMLAVTWQEACSQINSPHSHQLQQQQQSFLPSKWLSTDHMHCNISKFRPKQTSAHLRKHNWTIKKNSHGTPRHHWHMTSEGFNEKLQFNVMFWSSKADRIQPTTWIAAANTMLSKCCCLRNNWDFGKLVTCIQAWQTSKYGRDSNEFKVNEQLF